MKVSRNLRDVYLDELVLTKQTGESTSTTSDGYDELDGGASATVTPEIYYTYEENDIKHIPFNVTFPNIGTYIITQYDKENKIYSGFGYDPVDGKKLTVTLQNGIAGIDYEDDVSQLESIIKNSNLIINSRVDLSDMYNDYGLDTSSKYRLILTYDQSGSDKTGYNWKIDLEKVTSSSEN